MHNPLYPLYEPKRCGTGGVHVSAMGVDEPKRAPDGVYVPPLEGSPKYGITLFPEATDELQYFGVLPKGSWWDAAALISHYTDSATVKLELLESAPGAGDGVVLVAAGALAPGVVAVTPQWEPTGKRHILAATLSAVPTTPAIMTLMISNVVPPRV